MSTDDVERLWELRMETLATLTEADAALVSDLEILMPDEDAVAALESLAAQRRRGVLASVGSDVNRGRFMQSLEGREWAVDLVGLATDPDLGFGPAFAARPALSRWANETMPLLQSRHDALMSVGRTWDALMAWRVEQSRDRGNGDGRRGRERGRDAGDLRARWQSAMELGERVSQIEGRLASLNRETAERLRSELDATANQRFADAYLTRAFPAAVGPRREMERLVGRVLELPDLTEDQRMDIREAQASFDESARELQDRVVSIYREATGSDASGRDGWREIRRRREQFSEIEFDQRELDEKTRRRILAVLTPDQAELIGPLASERP